MDKVDLNRYEDAGRLGSGADYEVRAALDRETGKKVVLKRPVAQMISRQMHAGTEARTERTLQVYDGFDQPVPGLVQLIGYTDRANHDDYYGDDLGVEYRVTVEERAVGIPLFVSDPRARITKVPVGTGQNLFALFPIVQVSDRPILSIHQQLLDLEEHFLKAGYMLLDLMPQNIFYQPSSGQITVIDCGGLVSADGEPTTRGKPQQDINDCCLEILKYYTTSQQPPVSANGYRDGYGLRPVVNFEEELDEMYNRSAQMTEPMRIAAQSMFTKVRNRSYSSPADFREDLSAYLETVAEQNSSLPEDGEAKQAWVEAMGWLRGDFWQRFIFDADTELAGFDS